MSDNSAKLFRLTYLFAGIGLLVLAGLFAASLWLFEANQSSTNTALNSRERRSGLVRLLSIVQDAETGQRGYLLTREKSYLQPYEAAKRDLAARLAEVQTAFRGDTEQLPEIEKLIREKLDELALTIRLEDEGRHDEAIAIVKSDRGLLLMNQLRTIIGAKVERAESDLGRAVHDHERTASLTRQLTVASALMILGAALGGFLTIIRYTRELIAARTEVETLNASLDERVKERTEELQRANDEIQRFAYIVSHDLRSPLVNVMGYTSELEASLDSLKALATNPEMLTIAGGPDGKRAIEADIPESIGFIRRSTAKMDGLIKAILKLSREGQRSLVPEHIDLYELLDSLVPSVQHRLNELEGTVDIRKPMGSIASDRMAVEQIFGNLIDNAIKYRQKSVPPRIVVRQLPSRWGTIAIEVEDNGRGIAPDDHGRVFDLFRRAGAQDQAGEGIGLAHVRAVVRRLGGDVSMTSQLGRGTTFRITLSQNLIQPEQRRERQ